MNIELSHNFSPIAANFDAFIIDLWGVLHDGTAPYPGALECLKKLRESNKKIILLSNAPRRAFKAAEVLEALGFSKDLYDEILTSGEATFNYIKATPKLGYKYYYIGPEKDQDILDGLPHEEVKQASEADFALVTGFDYFGQEFESKLPQIQAALTAGLKVICANPDRNVVRQSGETMLCAGLIGEHYEANGGKVIWFGKPYTVVYEECLKMFQTMDESIDTSKICAIGDSLHTDVAGANQADIYSILVAGGILANRLEISDDNTLPKQEILEKICTEEKTKPKALIPSFIW